MPGPGASDTMPAMAIRFQCAACSQPIEVDDEWASKAVTCPYCRKAVTAPAESTLDQTSFAGSARSLLEAEATGNAAPYAPGSDPWHQSAPPAPPRRSNGVAIVGFVFGAMSLFCALGYAVTFVRHGGELMETLFPGGQMVDPMDGAEALTEKYDTGFPAWLVLMNCFIYGGLAAWLAGLICSIIGMTRNARKGWAVGGLVLAVLAPLVVCSGIIFLAATGKVPQPAPPTSALLP